MKKMFALALVLACVFAAGAAAEEPGVIVQSSCSIVPFGDAYLTYCYAQVHNNTDQVLCLDEGTFELMGGEEPLAVEEVSKLWPQFVAPGTDGYFFDVVPFETMPAVTGLNYNVQYLTINPAYAGVQMDVNSRVELDENSGMMSIVCELTNPAQGEGFNPMVAMGLYTDAGQLVYADGCNLKDVGVTAGGTVLVRFEVEADLVQQWISYGALPTQVQVKAMYRTGSD